MQCWSNNAVPLLEKSTSRGPGSRRTPVSHATRPVHACHLRQLVPLLAKILYKLTTGYGFKWQRLASEWVELVRTHPIAIVDRALSEDPQTRRKTHSFIFDAIKL